MWGEHKSTLNGCTGPLPGSPSSAHSGSCGVKEPAARPPPLSVRGLSGVGLTSAPHRTFADPAPPLPTYSATPPPPDPIIPDATYRNFVSWDPSAPLPWWKPFKERHVSDKKWQKGENVYSRNQKEQALNIYLNFIFLSDLWIVQPFQSFQSLCLLFPYSSACYYNNIVRPTCLGPTWGEYDPVYFTSLPVYQLVQCT